MYLSTKGRAFGIFISAPEANSLSPRSRSHDMGEEDNFNGSEQINTEVTGPKVHVI